MTQFNIDQCTDLPDCIYVEVDQRFNMAINRTETGLEIRVYPRTGGALWDAPFDTFTVDEEEIVESEAELRQ